MKKQQKPQRNGLAKAGPSAELGLIDQIRSGQRGRSRGVVLGIGDDCAILRPPAGHEVLVTTDFSLEGRHFRRDLHPAASVGHRCLARGLSDLAAMGATPLAAFLSLALPREMLVTAKGRHWVRGFFAGLQALGERRGVPLAGGDTAESPDGLVLADITLIGSAPAGKALRRSGGRAGELLYCTGQLGGAAAELKTMFARGRLSRVASTANHPQLFPEPRHKVGAALLKRGLASACLDLSDGLSTDLGHLCDESGVHAEVEEGLLPIHPLAAAFGPDEALRLALNGGEDYELLFSARADVRMPSRLAGVTITRIGRLTRRRKGAAEMTLVRGDGGREPLLRGGWEHFVS
jgi:thiamine-monophosphate kinase